MNARMPELRSVEDARRELARFALKPVRARIPLPEAAGHILAADARADRDIPPFDRAAVDGYAIRLREPWKEGNEFAVLGMLPASRTWEGTLGPGCAIKVMTGAPVPRGADGVVMVERSQLVDRERVRLYGSFAGGASSSKSRGRPGMAPRGEDARRGQIVLRRGCVLDAPQIAVLASVGIASVEVFRRPSVEILTTGAEVVQPSETPTAGQVRNANGPGLEALLQRSGSARLQRATPVPDDFRALCKAIRRARAADVLVLTGGVSAGDLDLVPDALKACDYRIRVHRIALRPGKPFLFGTAGAGTARRAVFGLPGNPVSVQVTAWEFLLPYLRAAAGWTDPAPRRLRARVAKAIERLPGLDYFVLGECGYGQDDELWVRAIAYHGSGDYVAAAGANCLIPLPAENPRLRAGDSCWIHPWGF